VGRVDAGDPCAFRSSTSSPAARSSGRRSRPTCSSGRHDERHGEPHQRRGEPLLDQRTSPRPVASPRRAAVSWTADASGKQIGAVHTRSNLNDARSARTSRYPPDRRRPRRSRTRARADGSTRIPSAAIDRGGEPSLARVGSFSVGARRTLVTRASMPVSAEQADSPRSDEEPDDDQDDTRDHAATDQRNDACDHENDRDDPQEGGDSTTTRSRASMRSMYASLLRPICTACLRVRNPRSSPGSTPCRYGKRGTRGRLLPAGQAADRSSASRARLSSCFASARLIHPGDRPSPEPQPIRHVVHTLDGLRVGDARTITVRLDVVPMHEMSLPRPASPPVQASVGLEDEPVGSRHRPSRPIGHGRCR